jgi:glycosyltransferase involved in cell wall biosynthesis
MKLWWINQHARPPIFAGGTRHFNLAKRLCSLQNDVMIVNGTFDHLGNIVLPEEQFSGNSIFHTYGGVPFLSISLPQYSGNASLGRIRNMYSFYLKTLKALSPNESKYGKPDIIIGSTVHPWAAYAGYKLSQMYNIPFVYEVRDLWPLTLMELGRIKKWNPLVFYFDRIDKILSKKASLIITTAPLMKKYYIERWGLPENKFLWITNGTNLSTDSEYEANQGLLAKKKERSPFQVVYTGALGRANGLIDILQVISAHKKELSNFEFHFWGDGPLKESLSRYIEHNNLPCFIHKSVPKERLISVLQSADALLFYLRSSKLYEYGISLNKVADYHAAGKPIIAVGQCAKNPVLESGAGFVIPSAQNLPEALLKFQDLSTEERNKMSENGLKYAQEYYDWGKLAEKLNTQLKKLV